MKFKKQIFNESINNPGLYYINFKRLKKILQNLKSAYNKRNWKSVDQLNEQFLNVLLAEVKRVEIPYNSFLAEINELKMNLTLFIPSMKIDVHPSVFTNLKFEQLLEHLQYAEYSEELNTFCSNLGKISTLCKRLRKYIIWNSIAVIKIIKKKNKWIGENALPGIEAAEILSKQNWYCSDELPQMISMIETTVEIVMSHLTEKQPIRENYTCPICLDLIVDPVTLKECSHRFCWNCLAHAAISAKEVGSELERCPYCRIRCCNLNPDSFVVDGILSRFLRRYFPEDTKLRSLDDVTQRETLVDTFKYASEVALQRGQKHFGTVDWTARSQKITSDNEVSKVESSLDCSGVDSDEELLREAITCSTRSVSDNDGRLTSCRTLDEVAEQEEIVQSICGYLPPPCYEDIDDTSKQIVDAVEMVESDLHEEAEYVKCDDTSLKAAAENMTAAYNELKKPSSYKEESTTGGSVTSNASEINQEYTPDATGVEVTSETCRLEGSTKCRRFNSPFFGPLFGEHPILPQMELPGLLPTPASSPRKLSMLLQLSRRSNGNRRKRNTSKEVLVKHIDTS